jgi:hypothetical protein
MPLNLDVADTTSIGRSRLAGERVMPLNLDVADTTSIGRSRLAGEHVMPDPLAVAVLSRFASKPAPTDSR